MLAIFDLDNTLVDRDAAIGRWALKLLHKESLAPDRLGVILEADESGVAPRDRFLAEIHGRLALTTTLESLQDWYEGSYTSCYVIENDSVRALESLRSAGWKIGVATDGSPDRQTEKLRRSGLIDLVDAICASSEVGASKPDPSVFYEVAARCKSELSGWMIGDGPDTDIVGGALVGLRTIWLRRGRVWGANVHRPDVIVDSIGEAAAAILR